AAAASGVVRIVAESAVADGEVSREIDVDRAVQRDPAAVVPGGVPADRRSSDGRGAVDQEEPSSLVAKRGVAADSAAGDRRIRRENAGPLIGGLVKADLAVGQRHVGREDSSALAAGGIVLHV